MYSYDAFISYSQKDKPVAAALQSVIQSLGKPWYQRRALRLFRDDTTLSATPHLWSAIEQALDQSRFLILLASVEAGSSKWVDDEVAYWIKHKSKDNLLLAVTNGELVWDRSLSDFRRPLGVPLPPALEREFSEEPRWIDFRPYGAGADTRDAKFIDLAANFASAIHGIAKEDLLSREVRQQRRNLMIAWSTAASLLVLAGLTGWQWWRAEQTAQAATATANDLVFEIADRFRDRQGIPNDLVASVLEKAQAVTESLLRLNVGGAGVARSSATALTALSVVLQRQGQGSESVKAAGQAAKLFEQLAGRNKASSEAVDLATAYDRLGEANKAAGDAVRAREAFTRSYEIAITHLRGHEDHRGLKRIAAVGLEKSGEVVLETKPAEALDEFMRSARLREELIRQAPDVEIERQLAISYERIADALLALKRNGEALREYEMSLNLTRKLYEGDRSRTDFANDYATINQKLGRRMSDEIGDDQAALAYFAAAANVSSQLAATNASRADLQLEAGRSKSAYAEALSKSDQIAPAIQQLLEIIALLPGTEQASAEWSRVGYDAHLLLAQLLMSSGTADRAVAQFEKAAAFARRTVAVQGRDSDFALKLVSAVSHEADALIDLGRPIEAKNKAQAVVGEIRSLVAAGLAPQTATVQALGNFAWYAIIGGSARQALEAADEAIEIDNRTSWLRINKAHALLVLGQRSRANEQYLAAAAHPRADGKKWVDEIMKDFSRLSDAGVIFERISEAEAAEIATTDSKARLEQEAHHED
jgi:tetratricopeptide (TPR) repeat protein